MQAFIPGSAPDDLSVHEIGDRDPNHSCDHAVGEELPKVDAILSLSLNRNTKESENQGHDAEDGKYVGETGLRCGFPTLQLFDPLPPPARDVFKSKAEGGIDLVKLALDLSMEIGNFEDFLPLPVVAMVVLRVHELNEVTPSAEFEELVPQLLKSSNE